MVDVFQEDTFTRANQSGWNPASNGANWTSMLGSPTLSIVSNEGQATGASGDFVQYLSSSQIADAESLVRTAISDTGNDASGAYLRLKDTNNFYRCFLGEGGFFIDKKAAGNFTGGIASIAASTTNNTFYYIRFHVQGTLLLARYWQTGTTEPTSWSLAVTDSDVSGAGYVGIGGFLNASGDVASFDHFDAYKVTTYIGSAASGLSAQALDIWSSGVEDVGSAVSGLSAQATVIIASGVMDIGSAGAALVFNVSGIAMLYDDVQTQYAAIRAVPTLVAKIIFMAKVYFPPSKNLDESAVPGEIDVLLIGETWPQLHELKSISDVNTFIATYS